MKRKQPPDKKPADPPKKQKKTVTPSPAPITPPTFNLATLPLNPPPGLPPTAVDRLKAANTRGKGREKFERGRFDTIGGPVGISDDRRQQPASRARKEDYSDETFGAIPAYSEVRKALPREGVRAIFDPGAKLPARTSEKGRLATSLAVSLSNVSDEERARGYGKYVRAVARQHVADPSKPHPLDPRINPAIVKAQNARDLMEGKVPLSADQQSAIDNHFSDDSDDGEKEYAATRKKLLKKRKDK